MPKEVRVTKREVADYSKRKTRSEGQFSTGVFSKRAEDQGGIRAIGMHMILAQALSAAALRRLQAFAGGKLA